MADTLAKFESETLCDRVRDVKQEALDISLPNTLAKVDAKTLRKTMGDVKT